MPLGIGVLSFAHGHLASYCDVLKGRSDARVLAAWDADPKRGQEKSAAAGAEFVPQLDAFLGRSDIQAVMIGSETAHHAEHVEAAARAGKDILLQKPMALTLEDCDRIGRAVRAAGIRFSMAWQMRCDPQNIWMREEMLSGRLGKLLMVRRRHGLNTHLWGEAFTQSWHVQPALNLGMFMDDASHAADWFLWNFGKPLSVSAEIGTLLNEKVPDDNGVAVFRFAGGMIGIIESSFTTVAAQETTFVSAERGSIVQDWGDLPSCSAQPEPGKAFGLRYYLAAEKKWQTVQIPTPKGHGERIRGVAEPALAFLKGERGPLADLDEGRAVTEMILAAYASSREGRRISLGAAARG